MLYIKREIQTKDRRKPCQEEEEVKRKRILFLLRVQEHFDGLDCCRLSARGESCEAVLMEIAEILQEIIEEKD